LTQRNGQDGVDILAHTISTEGQYTPEELARLIASGMQNKAPRTHLSADGSSVPHWLEFGVLKTDDTLWGEVFEN
jgi:hypothetical protein